MAVCEPGGASPDTGPAGALSSDVQGPQPWKISLSWKPPCLWSSAVASTLRLMPGLVGGEGAIEDGRAQGGRAPEAPTQLSR